jgi:hypothetical protein
MVEMKWKSLTEADPKCEYTAFTEIGERNSVWSYFSILMKAQKVGKQLKTAKGLIEFTARLEFLSKKMGMVAVFEDEKTLMEFAHAGQHAQCMEQFKAITNWQRDKWSISGSALPLKMDEAINRIRRKNMK